MTPANALKSFFQGRTKMQDAECQELLNETMLITRRAMRSLETAQLVTVIRRGKAFWMVRR